jgi:hypothetical protein
VAYSDPATGNQLAYLEALHRQLRGEVTPSFTDGLNRKQASVMIDEAKGLLLQKEHARLMALGLPIPEPAPAPPQNVTAIPTDARDEWAARKRDELAAQQRERRARSDTATAHLRDRYIAQFGGPNRYAPPQHMADDHRAFIVLWKARPGYVSDTGYQYPGEWRWFCFHEGHGHHMSYRGGTTVNGWSGCLQNAINHYQKYHCNPKAE